jgi:hypothetical protein
MLEPATGGSRSVFTVEQPDALCDRPLRLAAEDERVDTGTTVVSGSMYAV